MLRFWPLLLLVLMQGCAPAHDNAQLEEGKIAKYTYTNDVLGWELEIPEGWRIVARKEVQEMDEKGKEIVKKSSGQDVNATGLHHALNLRKDRDNDFASVYEPFSEAARGSWRSANENLKKDIVQTYTNMGLLPDASYTAQEKIGGIEFEVYDITVEDPEIGNLLNQTIYRAFVRAQLFTVSFTYKSEDAKNEMLRAFRKSTFQR